jgi:hypothetical protein
MYNWFGHDGCPAQSTLISFTLALTIILTIISCTKIAPHGTILTSGVVTAYCTYLCFSALASHPDHSCNPFAARTSNSVFDMLVGIGVASLSMVGVAWSTTGSKGAIMLTGKDQSTELTANLEDGSAKESSSAAHDLSAAPDEQLGPESWWYYHLMMVACSMYMAMLLTDWSSQPYMYHGVPATRLDAGQYNVSLGSFWVKVGSQWVCLAMYGWTLLAPYLLRDYRDFGIEFDLD